MSLSRRQFIQASGMALCAGAMPLTARADGGQNPLPVPPCWSPAAGSRSF
ncbi:Cell division protein FtsP precursor [Dickeya solani]|nr:Cell division protein FtsP precursor [Dickeya solani]QKO16498.1 Cell division protein FtsP precursor [Dickeya solani]